jgi:hypothetical protein
MEPRTICQGDYLKSLAYELGFDADTVWMDDKNADLRAIRPDPTILLAGDILYIPDQVNRRPVTTPLTTGTTNSFVSDAPTVTVNVTFEDPHLASQPCTIAELEQQLGGLTTDRRGALQFKVPVTLEVATVTFPGVDGGVTCACRIGHLDPVNTLSGIWQRLQNLGHIDDGLAYDPTKLDVIRGGLRTMRYSSADGPGDSGNSGSPSDPGSSKDPGGSSGLSPSGDPAVGSSSDPGEPANADPSEGYTHAGTPVGEEDSGAAAPNPSTATYSTCNVTADMDSVWHEGLNDDGTLDDQSSKRLLAAHGC